MEMEINKAIENMKMQNYEKALILLRKVIRIEPDNWSVFYMAGQCCRFLNDLDSAISYLKKASILNHKEPIVFLALGIALQLKENYEEAIECFKKALDLDPDYDLAFNSLALTQKKMGELDKALHNYKAGVMALTRTIVRNMRNIRENIILEHQDTTYNLWAEYALYGATYLCCSNEEISVMGWLSGEAAVEEARTRKHQGLYWIDHWDEKNKKQRIFLPNYFNTFREKLIENPPYSKLIGNMSTVYELQDNQEEAKEHYIEATEFSSFSLIKGEKNELPYRYF